MCRPASKNGEWAANPGGVGDGRGANRAHRGAIQPDGFVLGPDKRGGDSRKLKYMDLLSAATKMTVGTKWLIAGVVYGIVAAFSLILGR